VRSADAASGSLGRITGYASKFDVWSTITERDSTGGIVRYLERVQPGAYAAASTRDPSGIRVLHSHGHDSLIGSRPIATLDTLTEDSTGLRYAGRLLDTIAGREVAPMLAAGVLGSSYRFRIDDQAWDDHPGQSSHNPTGLPERTIRAATVIEVGPTPFPAQTVTTAGIA